MGDATLLRLLRALRDGDRSAAWDACHDLANGIACGREMPALPPVLRRLRQQAQDGEVPPGPTAGGKARAAKLTPEQRKAIAQAGAAARWGRRADG